MVAAPPAPAPFADAVLRGPLAAAARDCYRKALARDPTAEGGITVGISVGPAGSVTSVDVRPRGIDAIATECIRHAASTEVFSPPPGGAATATTTYEFPRPGSDYAVLLGKAAAPLAACAQAAGTAHGTLVLLVSIHPEGTVRAIDVRSYEGLTRDTAACAARAISKLTFVSQNAERAALVTVQFDS
jgi:outer membrane biosynthesis protein TonB